MYIAFSFTQSRRVRSRVDSFDRLFKGKKIFLWIAENSGANVIKASISNYAATLTQNSRTFGGVRNKFQLLTEDGMFYRFMYSKNF